MGGRGEDRSKRQLNFGDIYALGAGDAKTQRGAPTQPTRGASAPSGGSRQPEVISLGTVKPPDTANAEKPNRALRRLPLQPPRALAPAPAVDPVRLDVKNGANAAIAAATTQAPPEALASLQPIEAPAQGNAAPAPQVPAAESSEAEDLEKERQAWADSCLQKSIISPSLINNPEVKAALLKKLQENPAKWAALKNMEAEMGNPVLTKIENGVFSFDELPAHIPVKRMNWSKAEAEEKVRALGKGAQLLPWSHYKALSDEKRLTANLTQAAIWLNADPEKDSCTALQEGEAYTGFHDEKGARLQRFDNGKNLQIGYLCSLEL